MARANTPKKTAVNRPNAIDLEIKELKQQLHDLQAELDAQTLKLGATQSQLEASKLKNEQLEQELAEKNQQIEKRDQVITIRITKSAKEFLQQYADENTYTHVSTLISDFICKAALKKEKFSSFMHGLN